MFRGIRVSPVEVSYQLWCVEIMLGNPRVLLATVSFPPHQVQQPPALHPAIYHLVNLIPLLPSYDLGWWRQSRASANDRIRWGRHEFDDMENGMEPRH